MPEVIAIANQKGGVGKTITAAALSAGLTMKGFRVLSVDMDAQRNFSFLLGVRNSTKPTVFDVLTGEATIDEAIQTTERGDAIAAGQQLAAVDFLIKGKGREYKLRDALHHVEAAYDFVVIDTPPALGTLTVNALTAASGVLVPALADVFSVQGVLELGETIRGIRQRSNPALRHYGLLITRHNERSVIGRGLADVIREAAQREETKVFNVRIRDAVAVRESAAQGTDIFTYAPKSRAAADYRAFIEELLGDIGSDDEGGKGNGKR